MLKENVKTKISYKGEIMMKRILVAAALSVGLIGCNEMKGTLSASENLSLNDKDGKVMSVAAGTYNAELEAKDKTTVKVKIEGAGKKGKDLKFYFNLPANAMKSGQFDIPASQTGQPYGVRGNRDIETTESDVQRGYESCQYEDWEQYCWADRQGRVVCQTRRVTRWGQRYVEYTDVTETEVLALDLINASSATAAHFDGSRSESYRNYRYQNYCR